MSNNWGASEEGFDPRRRIRQNYGFFELFKNRTTGAIFGIGVLIGIFSPVIEPLLPADFSLIWGISYVLFLIFVITVYNFYGVWEEIAEQENLSEFIDPKRRTPAVLSTKKIHIEVNDNGPDHIVYSFHISAAFDESPISEFWGMIGTDKEVTDDDLEIEPTGGELVNKWRRDYREFRRFLCLFKLDDTVQTGDKYPLRYSFDINAIDPREDFAYLLVREPTQYGEIIISFPEGWRPTGKWCFERDNEAADEEKECEDDPTVSQRDGRWVIEWHSNNLIEGESYRVEWTAEKLFD